ncbi:MAG: SCO family protein [Phycisphaerales bacterium]
MTQHAAPARHTRLWVLTRAVVAALSAFACLPSLAQSNEQPEATTGLDIEEHLGAKLPLETTFTNQDGKTVRLGDAFTSNKPSIVVMVYYNCPVACPAVLDKLLSGVKNLEGLDVGKDFQILIFSFNPDETPDQARAQQTYFLEAYNRDTSDKAVADNIKDHWQFHVGETASNRALANALGFPYRRLDNGEYAHPTAIFITTPDAKIARYFHGFSYPAKDLKLALNEAASGRLMKSIGERIVAYCYLYDPKSGSYTLQAFRIMRVGALATLVLLASTIAIFLVGERAIKRRRKRLEAENTATPSTDPVPHDSPSDRPSRGTPAAGSGTHA